jgi:hypothetical protein
MIGAAIIDRGPFMHLAGSAGYGVVVVVSGDGFTGCAGAGVTAGGGALITGGVAGTTAAGGGAA